MPDHTIRRSHTANPPTAFVRQRRTDWRLGGRTVYRWRGNLLAIALISLGIAVLASAFIVWGLPTQVGALLADAVLWTGMVVPVVWAFRQSTPVGLMRFRPVDLLYGVGFGLALRLVQGWLEPALGGLGALPRFDVDGAVLTPVWWIDQAIGAGIISPIIGTFFFQAVLLIAVYISLRRAIGRAAAGLTGVLVSSALAVLVAVVLQNPPLDGVIALGLVGIISGSCVLLTGRVWGAVIVQVVFASSYVALALAGTALA